MYKILSDSTLRKCTKESLIEFIRCAENNWRNEMERAELLSTTLEHFTNSLIADGMFTIEQVNERLHRAQQEGVKYELK